MKTYLKDLTPEEIIKRMKNGEVIKIKDCEDYLKMIDGVLCRFYSSGDVGFGAVIYRDPNDVYFETEEPFKIEDIGFYKTRNKRKVFISSILGKNFIGIVTGETNAFKWTDKGEILTTGKDKNFETIDSNLDIISKWEN